MTWLPFELHPEIPPGGTTLEELFGPRHAERIRRANRDLLAGLAAEAGLPFDPPERVPRSRSALEAGEWVRRERSRGFPAFHRALFVAYWGEGRDIGERSVVLEVAAGAGVPPEALAEALERRAAAEAVDASTRAAVGLGVTGTPSWLLDGRVLVPGTQPAEVFDRVIERMGGTAAG